MSDGLLTAGAGHGWETELVAELGRTGAPFTVVRRCADLADVLAMASTGQAVAVVVSADLRRLDGESVGRLAGLGVAVAAVHRAGDVRAPIRLERIGIAVAISDDAGTAAILEALAGLVPSGAGESDTDGTADRGVHPGAVTPTASSDRDPLVDGPQDGATPSASGRLGWLRRRSAPASDPTVSDPAAALRSPPSTADPTDPTGSSSVDEPRSDDPAPAHTAGTVVAVWGPNGAPGRSTVAMGIADEAAVAGSTVLLIDADVYGGVLAAAFGLLDESPGLAGACRMASNGRLDGPTLAALCWSIGPRWSLLTGIARADRWPEVRPSAIPTVLSVARSLADLVVVDCAAILETDEEISFDTMAPRRNGATLAVLDDADTVIAVGAGDPPGIERLVRGLAQLGEAVPGTTPRVVVNRTRRTAASRREIEDAVFRFAGVDVAAQLPEDRDATDRAWGGCVGLSQAAPRSALRAGLAAVAQSLVPTGRATGPDGRSSIAAAHEAVAKDPAVVGADEPAGRRRRGRHAGADPG